VLGVVCLIEVRDLTFTYRNAASPSLRGIDLSVREGEFVLLAGHSGSGKSTLSLCLTGLIPHVIRGSMSGSVQIAGKDTRTHPTPELAQHAGIVFQNPDNQLFSMTVETDVAFGPENLCLDRDEMLRRVNEAIARTGLSRLRRRQVHHLSGGQKQRTAIAGILAMNPDLLVLDEPTADLDPSGTREVLETIHTLNRKEGRTIVIIEHKVSSVLQYVDRAVILNGGRIIRSWEPGECTPAELMPPVFPERSNPPAFSVRHEPVPVVELRNVSYAYEDGTTAINGLSFSVRDGEFVAVIGANGSGKSTMALLINGLLKPSSGDVLLRGKSSIGKKVHEIARTVGYLFQNPDHQIFTDRVEREIALGLIKDRLPKDELARRVWETLEAVHISCFHHRDPFTLSRGERQRLALASVLAMDPPVLILDEPTTGQDYANLQSILDIMERYHRQGKTIIMITHDMAVAQASADRIVVMDEGRITKELLPNADAVDWQDLAALIEQNRLSPTE
jgi:energy-coupling factor transporter ATP-binding protein EcfA2